MQRIAAAIGLAGAFFGGPARGQGVLNAGDVVEYHFDGLPLIGRFVDIPGRGTEAGILSVALVFGSLSAGEEFRVEMFEGDLSGGLLLSRTFGNPGDIMDQAAAYWIPGAWQDLNGAVRLTGLSGSAQLREITVNARRPVPGETGLYDLYSLSVPVPEPGVSWLGVAGCGLWGLRLIVARGGRSRVGSVPGGATIGNHHAAAGAARGRN